MAEAKTKPTEASVEGYLTSRASEAQREDCKVLMALLKKTTKQTPKMWGPSIVGYGSVAGRFLSPELRTRLGTTGEVLHVDAGYHVVGMKAVDAPDIDAVTGRKGD